MARKRTDDEWKAELSPEQYAVLRGKGTEAPFTGALLHNSEEGAYVCAACGSVVFSSEHKFDSGSGWPSFYEAADAGAVALVPDNSHGMERTEVVCAACGSHLGHIFRDAPATPTGMRYCVNSVALGFQKKD